MFPACTSRLLIRESARSHTAECASSDFKDELIGVAADGSFVVNKFQEVEASGGARTKIIVHKAAGKPRMTFERLDADAFGDDEKQRELNGGKEVALRALGKKKTEIPELLEQLKKVLSLTPLVPSKSTVKRARCSDDAEKIYLTLDKQQVAKLEDSLDSCYAPRCTNWKIRVFEHPHSQLLLIESHGRSRTGLEREGHRVSLRCATTEEGTPAAAVPPPNG